jgi:hypothetical protein
VRIGHALCGADRVSLYEGADDLSATGERTAVHIEHRLS